MMARDPGTRPIEVLSVIEAQFELSVENNGPWNETDVSLQFSCSFDPGTYVALL